MTKNPNSKWSRRQAIRSLVGGSLLFPGILAELLAADLDRGSDTNPLAPKPPHFPARAKRVIFLYMSGGVSQLETFDHKPRLISDHGKKIDQGFLLKPRWEFKPRGKSGTQVSELLPHLAGCMDDICLIRSMHSDGFDHFEAAMEIHTGSFSVARPSIGSWVSYGLGTINQNLPSFVVLAPHLPYAGGQLWNADFLPACHQGTRVLPGPEPIPNMARRLPSGELQNIQLSMVQEFNRRHLHQREVDQQLAARIKSFETAFGMQQEAPEAFDLSKESDATLKLYGLERGSTKGFAWQCLIARRLAERGVRFIELIDSGASNNWDAHEDMAADLPKARNVDQPIAGLLRDLKSRGMLDDTLVVWTTEFGRSPFNPDPNGIGRGHHPAVYCSWLAGAGVKPGIAYGTSDEYSMKVAENQVHVHDFHATILHLLGLDHEKLTFRHAGRDFRLTDVYGDVVEGILA